MQIELSDFGKCAVRPTGLTDLMGDLSKAVTAAGDQEIYFFGGGNPASIPEVNDIWRARMDEIMSEEGGLENVLCNYADPRGMPHFIKTLVKVFNERYGWGITEKNVCVAQGGQSAFFALFNLLAGSFDGGKSRKEILIPVAPEYIGYADQSMCGSVFRSKKAEIELIGERSFKYRVDFSKLDIRPETAAVCVSRPTNPTGNVLKDEEIIKLADLCEQHGIPLIVDNAYGAPFPSMLFTEANTIWRPNMILTMSLSKIGLPGTRTAIIIGPEEVVSAVVALTTISGLSNNNVGQCIVEPLIASGELFRMSEEIIRPYYRKKSNFARQVLTEALGDSVPWRLHENEGALFLWLWLKDLPIDSQELYSRLAKRRVFVIPGNGFFYGEEHAGDPHARECLRISYAQDEEIVRKGFAIMAEEIRKAYGVE